MDPSGLTLVVAAIGLCIFLASAYGFTNPARLIQWVNAIWERGWSMYAAVGARLALGVVFVLAAPETKFPLVIQIIGYLAIAAAVLLPIIGKERIARMLAWFSQCPQMLIRLWLIVGMGFGAFIVYCTS